MKQAAERAIESTESTLHSGLDALSAAAHYGGGLPSVSKAESTDETRDARRQDAAVDASRIQIRRTRGVEERIRRVRIQDVEHVNTEAKLSGFDSDVLAQTHVEHIQCGTDLGAV